MTMMTKKRRTTKSLIWTTTEALMSMVWQLRCQWRPQAVDRM